MKKIILIKFNGQKGFTQQHFESGKLGSMSSKFKSGAGFTLTELLISVIISLLILLIISSFFILDQKTLRKSNITAELVQNARITLDLMSREIRQAMEIVTILPIDDSDPGLIAHELQFEDGHAESQIQYIRYYLDNDEFKRQIIIYYFDTDPFTYVYWDDIDAFGPPIPDVIEDKIIGENFSNIDFYGDDNIDIELTLQKRGEEIEIKSIISPRNN